MSCGRSLCFPLSVRPINGSCVLFPYDVQVMEPLAIHQGNVAEMNTGEGKTLTATMPLYQCPNGKGSMLVTTMTIWLDGTQVKWAPVSVNLESSCRSALFRGSKEDLTAKRKIYTSDIVYTTNSVLG